MLSDMLAIENQCDRVENFCPVGTTYLLEGKQELIRPRRGHNLDSYNLLRRLRCRPYRTKGIYSISFSTNIL